MAITINGTSNTITGLAVGGLNDGSIALADLSATGTASASTFLRGDNSWAAAGGGITHASEFRINSAFSAGTSFTLNANWEEADDATYTRIGSAPTQSSGIFTLPAAGIWHIYHNLHCYVSSAAVRNFEASIMVSTDSGSNYDTTAQCTNNLFNSSDHTSGSTNMSSIVDVTNASNFRVKFDFYAVASTVVYGHTATSLTSAQFIRLGDT